MPKNKLYTLSYFRKRLRETGILSDVMFEHFHKDDSRYWAIVVSRNILNIIIFCYKKDGEFFFRIQTPTFYNFEIRTKSMKVVIDSIKKILETGFDRKDASNV